MWLDFAQIGQSEEIFNDFDWTPNKTTPFVLGNIARLPFPAILAVSGTVGNITAKITVSGNTCRQWRS